MCNEAVRRKPCLLRHVPDKLKTQEMCGEAVRIAQAGFFLIPDNLKTQEMCNEVVCIEPCFLSIPDAKQPTKNK